MWVHGRAWYPLLPFECPPAHKNYLVSNEIRIKLFWCFFQSHFIISYFFSLLSILGEKCQRLFAYLSAHSSVKLHAYLFNLSTGNSAIAYDKYYILISDTEVTKFYHNSILSVFQTTCNKLNLYFSGCNFWMTWSILKNWNCYESWLDYKSSPLLLQNTKLVFHKKTNKQKINKPKKKEKPKTKNKTTIQNVIFFSDSPCISLARFISHAQQTEEATSKLKRDTFSQSQVDVGIDYGPFLQPNLTIDLEVSSVLHRVRRASVKIRDGGTDGTGTVIITNEDFAVYIDYYWWHPKLLATAMFALSTVISFLRMLQYVVISDVVGPFQISLGSMVAKTSNFFVVLGAVMFAFAVGLCSLYGYYDEIKSQTCGGSDGVECTKSRFSK